MKPGDLAIFAQLIRDFPPKEIDRLHRVLLGVQEDNVDPTPDALQREHRAICSEDGHAHVPEDPYLRWLLDLAQTESQTPLNEKFLDVLKEANIILTTDGTTTGAGSEYAASARGGSVERGAPFPLRSVSPDSLFEADRIWQQAVALDRRKLASQALDQWRQKLFLRREAFLETEDPRMNQLADDLYRRNLARKAITHWRNTIREMQDLERIAVEHRAKKDAAQVLRTWTLAARERLFARVRDERLLHNTLGTWRGRALHIKEMEVAADAISQYQAAQHILEAAAAKKFHLVALGAQANQVYDRSLSRKVLNVWHRQLGKLRLVERRADAASEYYASKHALQAWRDKNRLRADEKHAQQAREQRLAVNFFRRWQAFVKRSKEAKYNAAYKVMRRKVKMNIGRAALNNWREKGTRIREMRLLSDEYRAQKVVENTQRAAHTAIIVMFNKTEHFQDMLSQAETFRNKRTVDHLQIFGSNWLERTRKILENQGKADEYRTIKTAGYTLSRLRTWRNLSFRTKRLDDDAEALFHRNEKKRARGFLQRWRQGGVRADQEQSHREEVLPPVTPAIRRSQLLASTTPAYTPGSALFRRTRLTGRLEEQNAE